MTWDQWGHRESMGREEKKSKDSVLILWQNARRGSSSKILMGEKTGGYGALNPDKQLVSKRNEWPSLVINPRKYS